MQDEMRTLESEVELVRPPRPAAVTRKTSMNLRQSKPGTAKVETPLAREIILRLIELFKQV
jgi:hypothetical protein